MADLFNYTNYTYQWELLYGTSQSPTQKKKENEKYSTIPLNGQQPITDNEKLTAEGNVPLVKATVNEKPSDIKTEKPTETRTETSNPSKEGRMIKAMKVMYPKLGWDNLNEDDKAKKVAEHVSTVDPKEFKYLATKEESDGRIAWLEKFVNDGNATEEETRIASKALKYLKDKALQTRGVENALSDKVKYKETSQLQVTEDMPYYEEDAQRVAVHGSAHSKFDSVKVAGSKKASQLKEPVQEYAVSEYLEGSKASSKETQITIGKNLVDQYGKFAKSVELNIHGKISASNLSEIVEYAGLNIYNLDKTHQAAAVKITVATGNEAAIKAAASQYAKYDKSAQSEIKSTITYTNYQEAKNELAKAELAKAELEAKNEVKTTSSTITATSSVDEKIAVIQESAKNQNSVALQQQVNTLTQTEAIALIKRCPSTSVIKAILNSNPSIAVLGEIGKVLSADELNDYKMIMPQLCFVGTKVQTDIINQSAAKNNLGLINRTYLNSAAKIEYDKALEKQKKEKIA